MALRLRVIGARAAELGNSSSKVFGVHGGSLWRADDNDWVLPDPERYVSGHHARIEYRDGGYWLTDTSSNGTFVNNAQMSVSEQGPYALKEGDRVRIGDYDMVVAIDATNDFPPDKSAIVAYDGLGASSAVTRLTEDDLGADLDLDSLLTDDSSARPMTPVNAYGLAVDEAAIAPRSRSREPEATPTGKESRTSSAKAPQNAWSLATRRIEPYRNPLRSSTAEAPPRLSSESTSPDALSGFQALCRGAGIDPASLPIAIQPQVLQLAGQILREMIVGLMDVTQNRTELRNRFRIAQPTSPAAQSNPLQQAAGVDDALRKLFEAHSRQLGPVEAVRDSFSEIKTHHQALVAAMHNAFMEFLARLDPEELQERFDRGLKRGGLLGAATNKMKYWELYGELYQSMGHTPKDELPHLFVEEFAKAYEAKLNELSARKTRTAG